MPVPVICTGMRDFPLGSDVETYAFKAEAGKKEALPTRIFLFDTKGDAACKFDAGNELGRQVICFISDGS